MIYTNRVKAIRAIWTEAYIAIRPLLDMFNLAEAEGTVTRVFNPSVNPELFRYDRESDAVVIVTVNAKDAGRSVTGLIYDWDVTIEYARKPKMTTLPQTRLVMRNCSYNLTRDFISSLGWDYVASEIIRSAIRNGVWIDNNSIRRVSVIPVGRNRFRIAITRHRVTIPY